MLFFRITSKCNYNNGGVVQTVTGYRQCNESTNACCYVSKDELMKITPYGKYYKNTHKATTYDSVSEIIARINKSYKDAFYIVD
jgi:hypothetical protein